MKNADKPASPTTGKSKYAGGRLGVKDDETEYSNGDGIIFFPGLTKREYFAAMALQGLLANPKYLEQLSALRVSAEADMNQLCAREAVDMADELLKQLEIMKPGRNEY